MRTPVSRRDLLMGPVSGDSRPASSQPRRGEKAHAEAKRSLRLQVQDFVNWLKAQGAM